MLSVEIFLGEALKFEGLSHYSSYAISKIIYAGMVNYYEVKGLKQPLTFEEIYDYIENSMLAKEDIEKINEVITEFSNCQALKRKTEDAEEITEALKKKGTTGITQELQPMQQD